MDVTITSGSQSGVALPRFRGECSERTFVYRVAHNRAITHVNRHA